MSPRPSAKLAPAVREGSEPSAGDDLTSPPVAGDSRPPAASKTKRPRRRASVLETRVGYRFADPALLARMSAALAAHRYRTHEFGDSVLMVRGRPAGKR